MAVCSRVLCHLLVVVVATADGGVDLNHTDWNHVGDPTRRLQTGDQSHTFTKFTDTCKLVDEDTGIVGFEPSPCSVGLPVFIWLTGGFSMFDSQVDHVWLLEMARRGFLAAAVDYVSLYDRLVWSAGIGGAKRQFRDLQEKAEKFPNAVSKLCARPCADCLRGVAVAGHSQGGFITIFSVEYDHRITAILALGVGCLEEKLPSSLTDVEVSKYLPESKRLYITGSRDQQVDPNCLGIMNSELQANGGGYIMLPDSPHQFFASCDPVQQKSIMKCSFSQSVENWGLTKVLDWLALAASPDAITNVESEETVACQEGLQITDTPKCNAVEGRHPWIYVVLILIFVVLFPCGAAIYCCLYPSKGDNDQRDDHNFDAIADDELELLRRFSSSNNSGYSRLQSQDFKQIADVELQQLESFVSHSSHSSRNLTPRLALDAGK